MHGLPSGRRLDLDLQTMVERFGIPLAFVALNRHMTSRRAAVVHNRKRLGRNSRHGGSENLRRLFANQRRNAARRLWIPH